MSKLTDPEVKNLSEDGYKTESLGCGRGALMIRKRGKTFQAFFRYWRGKQKAMVPIGSYAPPRTKIPGLSLKEIRAKANELATLRQQINPQDLKDYLEQQETDRQQQIEEKKRQQAIEDSTGTLTDLLNAYVGNLYRLGRSSARQVETSFNYNVTKSHPEIARKKARAVVVDDIIHIIRAMLARGVTTQCNRLRSYLCL